MEQEKQELTLIVINDVGKPQVSPDVEQLLDSIETQYKDITDLRTYVNEQLLDAMLSHNLKKATVGKYIISIRENKSKWIFNYEEFVKNESPELVQAFTTTEEKETVELDVEELKAKYPEAYKACLKTHVEKTTSFNENNLWKNLNSVWSKYATEVMPDKVGTISIKKVEN